MEEEKSRDLVIYTGEAGMRLIDSSIKKASATALLETLYSYGKVTIEEYDSFKAMIESEDERDFQLAKIVLDHKLGWEQN